MTGSLDLMECTNFGIVAPHNQDEINPIFPQINEEMVCVDHLNNYNPYKPIRDRQARRESFLRSRMTLSLSGDLFTTVQ